MNKINDTLIIPDVQSDLDERKISINKVGIKSIKHPVEFNIKENNNFIIDDTRIEYSKIRNSINFYQ